MTFGVRQRSPYDDFIAPVAAFSFSILVAVLAPLYPQWYGADLPDLTVRFLAGYPIWIAITLIALIVEACLKVMTLSASSFALLKKIDSLMGVLSVLIIIVGIIALALPALHGPSAI